MPYSAPRSESSYVGARRARSGTPRAACRRPRRRPATLHRATTSSPSRPRRAAGRRRRPRRVRDGGAVVASGVADAAARRRARPRATEPATPVTSTGRRRERLVERVEPRQQAAELEAAEDLLQLRAVGRGEHELGRVEVELEVAPHRRELLRDARLVGVLGDRPASGRARARRRARSPPRASRSGRSARPAVLSPIPGTPGMLSEVSPLSPMKSGTWSGRTP